MSEVVQGGLEGETPVNPYSLLEAVNNSSDTAHTAWLIFLGIMAYLMVAVAGVTHENLLLEKAVSLPILGVEIQQAQFFQFAPLILVLFHLGVVSQLVLLARKTLEFDYAVRALESTDRRTHPLRLEVHNFFFVQAIAGPHRSPIMGAFLHGISWLTLVILPVILLLYIQISFLPYHSITVTWTHRLCVLADIIMLVMLGIFLLRLETSFWAAFIRTSVHHPITFLITLGVLVATALFSFFVATVPGERLDQWTQAVIGSVSEEGNGEANPNAFRFAPVPFVTDRRDGTLFGRFHRNLIVTDIDFVPDRDAIDGEATRVLRDRDLRYAKLDRSDLHGADLTGADLDGASLVGADLRWIRLQCADIDAYLKGNRDAANCPSAKGANFSRARLGEAKLAGGDFTDARFDEADLVSADLSVAVMSGASFFSARLDKATLSGGVRLQSANFLLASLQGADLGGAEMQYADFSSAQMQAALLSYGQLQGALMRETNLEGADLNQAKLQGADMKGAVIKAADLRGAAVWMTTSPAMQTATLADASRLDIAPLSAEESETLSATLNAIPNPVVRIRVKERLAPLLEIQASRSWASTDDHRAWQDFVTASRTTVQPGYDGQLTGHLAAMVCRARWRNGAVATGVARRAQTMHFQGSPTPIYSRLTDTKCASRAAIDTTVMNRLSTRVDLEAERRPTETEPPVPSPVLANPGGIQP
ncbi:MAG: hypothetical protein RLZ98_713 [Pseudomonadota bacterium]|jgi:uncharacterized protein YjbI with pentapeptide repeats